MKKLNKVLVTTALVAGSFSPAAAFAATTNSPSDTLSNSLSNSGSNGSSLIPLDGTNHNFSTYKLTHSGFNGLVMPTNLISVANKSFDGINQAVQDSVRSMQPIHLTLSTDKLGTMGYSNAKLKVADSPSNVQLWAKNIDGNWVNVADNGWGPVAGFRLNAQANESVVLYLMNSGSYSPVKLQLVDLKNPDKILAEDDLTYTLPK
ncbi:hypothetical protein PP175_06265 [Aneurinibacillus sp. Ricciae_BoGa-3]|uniref:hypothetical protein n=1 Tax=Aneurinibacillus sp. Ricciae_BoGa-3 TaxID=3022697 RepID=UPI0023409CBB|nr:hypothetical protein [Aneurinibacillus sp. Ricciae_BoGa-3]WCK55545.1 hypothetical protein PP175_06265 [Aneurinibacillus sp. Ricciae_BoGa-3]